MKNIENAIIHHDDFINVNENNAFLMQIKEWYLSSEAHDLRQQLVTLITDIDLNYKMTLNWNCNITLKNVKLWKKTCIHKKIEIIWVFWKILQLQNVIVKSSSSTTATPK